jgi:hypothetical protein
LEFVKDRLPRLPTDFGNSVRKVLFVFEAMRDESIAGSESNKGTPTIAATSNTNPIAQRGLPASIRWRSPQEIPARSATTGMVIRGLIRARLIILHSRTRTSWL